jgi:hypothetical protein
MQRRDLLFLWPYNDRPVKGINLTVPRQMTRTPTHRSQAEVIEKGNEDLGSTGLSGMKHYTGMKNRGENY